mmetsp:Transcript_20833/g.51119  ORF Transcript_20833/g.51119 Transcript_20833/m.51119 type:complete len:105 (+) Transcript_20833:117-431(+)
MLFCHYAHINIMSIFCFESEEEQVLSVWEQSKRNYKMISRIQFESLVILATYDETNRYKMIESFRIQCNCLVQSILQVSLLHPILMVLERIPMFRKPGAEPQRV